jgi:hypothetical protein
MDNHEPEYKWQFVQKILFLIAFIPGSIGNVLVILVIIINRKLRTPINIYLLNLALADLLVFYIFETFLLF